MGRTDIYGNLKIEENNGVLIAKFKKSMKYGKLNNETLDIKEVENGMEVGGSLTEQQIIANGYKPVCEVEKSGDSTFCVYKEYDVCFVQVWKREGDEILKDEIWTAESGEMPEFADLQRLKADTDFVTQNINSINLSNKEKNEVKKLFPAWEDYIGKSLNKVGFTIHYLGDDKLYEILQPVPVVQEHQTPNLVPSNYGWVSEHEGTKEDPIPYEHMMVIRKDKYYTQNGKLYIGLQDAPNGYAADLETLSTLVKEVKE